MRKGACTTGVSMLLALAVAVFLNLVIAGGARANILTNGDFSSGLDGWSSSSGDFSIQTMENLPATLKNNWDLTPWNSVMNGNFALMHVLPNPTSGSSFEMSIPLTTPSSPISVSFDYAVASVAPADAVPGNSVAYFRLEMVGRQTGVTPAKRLVDQEIQWTAFPQKQVFTGTVDLPKDYFGPEMFDQAIDFWFSFWNSNGHDYIVGIDNIDISVLPAVANAAPVPEPASACLLLVSAVIGIGVEVFRRNFRGSQLA